MSMATTMISMALSFFLVQFVLVIFALVPNVASGDLNSRTVKTKYGDLKGVIVKFERNLGGVEIFRGVPYASPPVGNLRFMPPVNGAPWHGVKVADRFSPVCPQKLPELTNAMPPGRMEYLRRLLPLLRNQSEDCLYLNIYAPAQGMWACKIHLFCSLRKWHIPMTSKRDTSIRGNGRAMQILEGFASSTVLPLSSHV